MRLLIKVIFFTGKKTIEYFHSMQTVSKLINENPSRSTDVDANAHIMNEIVHVVCTINNDRPSHASVLYMELQQQTDHAHGSAHFTPLGH
jgi:hypothetical protein